MGARSRISAVAPPAPSPGALVALLAGPEGDLDTLEGHPVVDDARAGLGHAVGGRPRWAGALGALLPPRSTQVNTEGSSRCNAVATRATWVARPVRPICSTASASKPGSTRRGVPVMIDRVTTESPPMCASGRQASQEWRAGSMPSRSDGRPGRGADRVVGRARRLGLSRRARRRDDQCVALGHRDPVDECVLLAVGAHDAGRAERLEHRRAGGRREPGVERGGGVAGVPDGPERIDKAHPPGRSSATSSGTGQ